MLLAEDLLLLVTDGASGRLSAPAAQVDVVLGGANLVELAMMNKVGLSGQWDQGKLGRIIVRDQAPTGDEVLDAALGILGAHQGKKPITVVRPLSKNLRGKLYERLLLGGLVRAEQGRAFGVFRGRRWPVQDSDQQARVRRLMARALLEQAKPEPRGAALIALVHVLGYEQKIADLRECGLSRQQLWERAEELARGNWAAEPARQAIWEMIGAVATATSAAKAIGAINSP